MNSAGRVYDAVIVGGGHNGLVAAALLARAGRRVLLLERLDHLGGAAVSEAPFPGVDVRLSRYSYLVSLFPRDLLATLGVGVELRRRRVASHPPNDAPEVYALTERVARAVAPTLLEPLRSRAGLRALIDDEAAWEALFERPLSELLEKAVPDDLTRGIVATDALIGTFGALDDPGLSQNRCFLYHVIGDGTGDWDIPVGGMGALTAGLVDAAQRAGAELRTGVEVTATEAEPGRVRVTTASGDVLDAEHLLANAAPSVLAKLLGDPAPLPEPEGSQLKLNMVLTRLPRLRDTSIAPEDAFAGTFHVNESYSQLAAAYTEACAGGIPSVVPAEAYCHSLTDPSILSPGLARAGAQTLTVFALHMPARLFRQPGAKERAVASTLASLNSVLAEPIEDCLMADAAGRPCLEARTPIELEAELGLPGGNIFHRALSWPFAELPEEIGKWGVETGRLNVWLCGAGARRGGGVSGIPGHNAAMAILAL
ncbi:MAG TPA: NAD(P)/FAD-dependent oxidoreductase [Solirubrobacteraceae bacterium]|jgi:phytoene dehydrogenase-like protein|nr:NAD(P)/FAD-dependent oxidoreductase [Solirubrobacteraceae bacterium]